MHRIIILLAGGAFLSAFSPAVMAQSPAVVARGSENPSFDCATAKTGAARLICADGDLAPLDRELGEAFQKRKLELSATDQTKFVADELSWIRDRNQRCELVGKNDAAIEVLASSKPCMANEIRERIAFLIQADTAAALPQQPTATPLAASSHPAASQLTQPTQADQSDRVLKDEAEAMGYRKAAEQGDAIAQRNLGLMYEAGRGVPKDAAQAAAWYRKAAEQGDELAQYNLGYMYAEGIGVPNDRPQAINWYKKAAVQGYEAAEQKLAELDVEPYKSRRSPSLFGDNLSNKLDPPAPKMGGLPDPEQPIVLMRGALVCKTIEALFAHSQYGCVEAEQDTTVRVLLPRSLGEDYLRESMLGYTRVIWSNSDGTNGFGYVMKSQLRN